MTRLRRAAWWQRCARPIPQRDILHALLPDAWEAHQASEQERAADASWRLGHEGRELRTLAPRALCGVRVALKNGLAATWNYNGVWLKGARYCPACLEMERALACRDAACDFCRGRGFVSVVGPGVTFRVGGGPPLIYAPCPQARCVVCRGPFGATTIARVRRRWAHASCVPKDEA